MGHTNPRILEEAIVGNNVKLQYVVCEEESFFYVLVCFKRQVSCRPSDATLAGDNLADSRNPNSFIYSICVQQVHRHSNSLSKHFPRS